MNRSLVKGTMAALLWFVHGAASHSAERVKVDFAYVDEKAKDLAAEPYDDNWGKPPECPIKLGMTVNPVGADRLRG